MKKEFDDYLVQTFPKLFVERNLPMTQTCMCWGFDCGDGWFPLIKTLCERIQNHIDFRDQQRQRHIIYTKMIEAAKKDDFSLCEEYYNYGENFDPNSDWMKKNKADAKEAQPTPIPKSVPQVIVTQVKEKFGSLRFYYSGGDDYIAGLVDMACDISSITCETCGSPGVLKGKSWLYTACDQHTKPEDRENIK